MILDAGVENYEELKQQMVRAEKLYPRRREIVLDRIQELEFQKKTRIPSLEGFHSALIGMLAVVIAVLSISIQQQHAPTMIIMTVVLFALGSALIFVPSIIKREQKPYNEKIQQNHDILQGRKP